MKHDVGGFHVAVYNAMPVCVIEGRGTLAEDVKRHHAGGAGARREHLLERGAVDAAPWR